MILSLNEQDVCLFHVLLHNLLRKTILSHLDLLVS